MVRWSGQRLLLGQNQIENQISFFLSYYSNDIVKYVEHVEILEIPVKKKCQKKVQQPE